MTTLSSPSVLTRAIGGSSKLWIEGSGGLSQTWRVDVHKAGSGELLGYGPIDGNGNFKFEANHSSLQTLKGSFDVVVRFTDGTNFSYWSQPVNATIT